MIPNPQAKLLDQVREVLRVKPYALRTEGAYANWIRRFILFQGLTKPASCHSLRHGVATHWLEGGYDIRTVQEWLGPKEVSTTMIYTHVLNRPGLGMRSPLDPPG